MSPQVIQVLRMSRIQKSWDNFKMTFLAVTCYPDLGAWLDTTELLLYIKFWSHLVYVCNLKWSNRQKILKSKFVCVYKVSCTLYSPVYWLELYCTVMCLVWVELLKQYHCEMYWDLCTVLVIKIWDKTAMPISQSNIENLTWSSEVVSF